MSTLETIQPRLASARPPDTVRVAIAQARAIWLDPVATAHHAAGLIAEAAEGGARIVAFPETFLAGYPFWLSRTNGTNLDDPRQQSAYADYLGAAVTLDGPELAIIAEACATHRVWAFVGVNERGAHAGRGTVYCTLAVIDDRGELADSHRKLVPTHDERLVWGYGDGAGLRGHDIDGVRVGALLCWENWMPQARSALYADGIDVHLSLWPGSSAWTRDIVRFIAMEGRVWSLAVGGVIDLEDIPPTFSLAGPLSDLGEPLPFDGGSAAVRPDGLTLLAPQQGEGIHLIDCDAAAVRAARLARDPSGHYSRPDVFDVRVDRTRRNVP